MYQTKNCPKCSSTMEAADYISGYGAVRLVKFGDVRGDKVIPYYCKVCGYIELYNEKKVKNH